LVSGVGVWDVRVAAVGCNQSGFCAVNVGDLKERFAGLAEAVAVRRDQKAFGELFDYFAPRIKSYLQRLGMEPSRQRK
jgi:hypothetical protein